MIKGFYGYLQSALFFLGIAGVGMMASTRWQAAGLICAWCLVVMLLYDIRGLLLYPSEARRDLLKDAKPHGFESLEGKVSDLAEAVKLNGEMIKHLQDMQRKPENRL